MDETPEVKVEVKAPEKTEDTHTEEDKSWLMRIGELTAKVDQLGKEHAEHKSWLERLSHDVDEERNNSLRKLDRQWEEMGELSRRLSELEAMEIVEEMSEEIPTEAQAEQTEIIAEESPASEEPERKRPRLIV